MIGKAKSEHGRALLDIDSIDDCLLDGMVGGLAVTRSMGGEPEWAAIDDPWSVPVPARRENPSPAPTIAPQTLRQGVEYGVVGGLTLCELPASASASHARLLNAKASN